MTGMGSRRMAEEKSENQEQRILEEFCYKRKQQNGVVSVGEVLI